MNYSYLKYYGDSSRKEKSPSIIRTFYSYIKRLSLKQKISILILSIALFSNKVMAITQDSGIPQWTSDSFRKLYTFLSVSHPPTSTAGFAFMQSYVASFSWVEIPRQLLFYVRDSQTSSIDIVSRLPFGTSGLFNRIYVGLTIFAVIGVLYKLINHFLNTERFDNVKAYTGFFSYAGLIVLFIFSKPIVSRIMSLGTSINSNALTKISENLDNELSNELVADYKTALKKVELIEQEYEDKKANNLNPVAIDHHLSYYKKIFGVYVNDMYISMIFKYGYFTLFICLMTCILAIPSFIMAFMVKVLLTVMVLATKLVFLISLIPGFESTWKTFLLNMLNVILWVPIFNSIIGFIGLIMSYLITNGSLGSGEIIWMTVVVFVMSYQAITLTTTAAGTIISGAGASMAGAMSGLSAMNGASVLSSAGSLVASGASAGMTAGMTGAYTASAMKKFMK